MIADGTGRFALFVGALVYASIYFRRFRLATPFKTVKLVPTDIVMLIVTLPALALFLRRRHVVLSRVSLRFLAVASVFLLYHLYLLTKAPQPVRGVTLVLLLIRDLILVGILLVFLDRTNLARLNRVMFRVSVVVSLLMVPIYLFTDVIARGPLSVLESTILVAQVPRAQWFVSDPNFFGLLLLVGLFCGFAELDYDPSPVHYLMMGVVSIAIVMTASRSIIGLTIVTTVLRLFGPRSVVRRRESRSGAFGALAVRLVVATVVFAVVTSAVLGATLEGLLLRLRSGLSGGRLSLWQQLTAGGLPNPVTGAGLRASEEILGRYSHNSYLSLLYDGGLVDLGLYVALLGTLGVPGFRAWVNGQLGDHEPQWWAIVALVPFLFVFSHAYQPITWLIFGTLGAARASSGTGSQAVEARDDVGSST